ncbi:MAG: ribose-phosphate pyrophosphokinase [Gammaproteobacteria bacterium]|nr:ribose-phosphate pyrophosphokinase [Gammaproteobacteria bacterium]
MATYHGEKIRLFSLTSNPKLAQEVSELLDVPLTECEVSRFADGEVNVNISETVRGHKVFIIQSTSAPVNERYMELLIFIDALKRASAKEITVVMPYYGYSRQDRKAQSRQPISAKLIADLLTVAGATRVISLDLHAPQIQGFFNIPIDNLRALPLFHQYIFRHGIKDMVVVSPDHGGANRARQLADAIHTDIAIIDKRRPRPNVSQVMHVIGEVEGKNCIILDDLIDTGGTIYNAAQALKKNGAKDIYVFASHGLFSGDAKKRLSDTNLIKKVIITDSIERNENNTFENLDVISIAELLSQAIQKVVDNSAMSPLFQ